MKTAEQQGLQAIQRYGGTLSAAPNFGYELCLKRISDQQLAEPLAGEREPNPGDDPATRQWPVSQIAAGKPLEYEGRERRHPTS